MGFATLITMIYQWMLNDAFQPLIQHLPRIRCETSKKATEVKKANHSAYFLRRIKNLGQGLENINTIDAMSEEEINALAAAFSANEKHVRSLTEKFRHEILSARSLVVWLPRRQKSAPTSPPIGHRVSAALKSRDLGDCRATLGDPGWSWVILGGCAPFGGMMLPVPHFIRNPFDSVFTSRSAICSG